VSRAQRLLDLIQLLRRHRFPISGAALAQELGVSLRTLYRDIETLNAQGARIDGEAGIGYVLRPGFMLPPLMFSEEEIEALVLGSRWVAERADAPLSKAARNALAKIAELATIRQAIRTERKLSIAYVDQDGAQTRRMVWPFALAFFDRVRIVAAWCELRGDYRHFRTDRIAALKLSDKRYPRRRQALLKEWRTTEGIPPQ